MTLGAAALYLVAVATYWMWYAGVPATPARFAAAILPVFAVPLARLWSAAGASGRAALATMLAVSLAITAVVDRRRSRRARLERPRAFGVVAGVVGAGGQSRARLAQLFLEAHA